MNSTNVTVDTKNLDSVFLFFNLDSKPTIS